MSLWLSVLLHLSARAAAPDLTSPDHVWLSNNDSAYAGYEIVALGDVDGDGYDDFAAMLDYYIGDVGVFHGGPEGIETFPRIVVNGGPSSYYDSVNLAGGDFDGDGYADLAIGNGYEGTNDSGMVRIWFGTPDGLLPYVGWEGTVAQDNAGLGWGLDGADVNNDGYDDVLAGAPFYDNGQDAEGAVFVWLGSAVGPGTTPNQVEEGDVAFFEFGWAVEAIGDVNGDGFEDIAVASPFYDNPSESEGRVSVYHGRPGGIRLAPQKVWEPDQALVYLGYYADSFADGGDFNGDGYDDLLVGLYNWDNGAEGEGRVVAFSGSGAGLSVHPTWQIEGNQAYATMGLQVACAGDVDDDGYDDALIGSYGYDAEFVDGGRLELYRGGPAGLEQEPSAYAYGTESQQWIGWAVAGIGDVNGDGVDDMASAAPYQEDGETDEGVIYAWYGIPAPVEESAPFGGPSDLEGANLDGDPRGLGCNAVPVAPGLAWLAGLLFLRRRR